MKLLRRSQDELVLAHLPKRAKAWPILHRSCGWHHLGPVDKLLVAALGDRQAPAALFKDVLSVHIIQCAHNRGSTGQHGDLQNVPPRLGFGSEGAVQQQLVRC
eukprot:3726716-Amphidinium_carterae.1